MNYYYSLNKYYRNIFGCRIQRIALHTNSNCPNRDGSKSTWGCAYCSPVNLIPTDYNNEDNVHVQLERGIKRIRKKYGDKCKTIAYFQDGTFTYTVETSKLYKYINPVYDFPEAAGISIGTRPDCLNSDIIDLFKNIKNKLYLEVELGLQTANDNTLIRINRHHTVRDFVQAVNILSEINIPVIAHIILGLPGETKDDFNNTLELINALPLTGLKLHNLHIIKESQMEKDYIENKIKVLEMNEYIKLTSDFISRLRKDIVIYRLMGESSKDLLIAPEWVHNKRLFYKNLNEYFKNNNLYQGKYL